MKGVYSIALFGGTFDPFHKGHLELIENLYAELMPDRMMIIPAGHPYMKEDAGRYVTPAVHRIGMTAAGLENLEIPWEISTVEADKDTPSYSIDTVRHFLENGIPEEYSGGNVKVYFLCGSDVLFAIDRWHEYRELLRLVTLSVVPRGDDDTEKILLRKTELEKTENASIYISRFRGKDISSSLIRGNVERYKKLVPEGTYGYIKEHGLYGLK